MTPKRQNGFRLLTLIAVCICLSQATSAQLYRQPITNLKPLLLAAITQGQAFGVLEGQTARLMREQFGSTAPIEVDVIRLRPLAMPGCHRLSVKTKQAGVREGSAPPKDMVLGYEVNYCKDGQFPEDRIGVPK